MFEYEKKTQAKLQKLSTPEEKKVNNKNNNLSINQNNYGFVQYDS